MDSFHPGRIGNKMRKIAVMNRISVDGYFASNNEATFGMDWFVQDPEVDVAVRAGDGKVDGLIMGKTTYLGFERGWVPILNDPDAPEALKAVAQELTAMHKYVFSGSLEEAAWANSTLYRDRLPERVRQLKEGPGDDILIFGSGSIVQQLANANLIDEYLLILTPVVAGEGKLQFRDVRPFDLKLLRAQSFASGNVLLHYAVK